MSCSLFLGFGTPLIFSHISVIRLQKEYNISIPLRNKNIWSLFFFWKYLAIFSYLLQIQCFSITLWSLTPSHHAKLQNTIQMQALLNLTDKIHCFVIKLEINAGMKGFLRHHFIIFTSSGLILLEYF